MSIRQCLEMQIEMMFVQKETINKHFKKEKAKTGIGNGQFLKKNRNDCYAKEW